MREINFEIDAHKDFELGNNRPRKLTATLMLPEVNITGLAVYVAGFGNDASQYRNNFAHHICQTYSMACLFVNYHCYHARPNNGGTVTIESDILKLLRSITGSNEDDSVDAILFKLNEMGAQSTTPIIVPAMIYPAKNEYQNFGLLAALDHIYAINHVLTTYPKIPKRCIALGSSYGGYIANLISKFAPCTLDAVLDNSSWADPVLDYIVGKEMGSKEFRCDFSNLPNLTFELNVLSPWSYKASMPNAFNSDRYLIRAFTAEHLETMAKAGNRKTIYRMMHSSLDEIANPPKKLKMVQSMKKHGFDVEMKMLSEKDIDGTYVKSMEHGMGLSMRQFFATYYPDIKNRKDPNERIDFEFKHSIKFECETQNYTFEYSGDTQPICLISDR